MTQLFGGENNWDRVPDNPAPRRRLFGRETETGDTKRNYPNRRTITYHVPVFLRFSFLQYTWVGFISVFTAFLKNLLLIFEERFMALPAILLLEGEEPFYGRGVGADGIAHGVMVASAFSAGIPDLLTDPAYGGKIVCFTYPHIGTSGVVPGDLQGDCVAARAVAAREIGRFAANRLGTEAMDAWLARNNIPAMEGLDTRSVTEIVARRGLVRAVMGTGRYADPDALAREFAASPDAWNIERAGVKHPVDWTEGAVAFSQYKVVVHDFGVKRGFLRRLAQMGCAVRVVPAGYPADKTMSEKPNAVVFSSGVGVPDSRLEAIPAATQLLGKVPLWGVGVGAGVLAAAAGARTTVNGRGHFGVQPVTRVGTSSGAMTAQAREFWVEEDSLAGAGLALTHKNLNDGSVEGFKCDKRAIMGVLFNPEGEPGQHDSLYLFDQFIEMVGKFTQA